MSGREAAWVCDRMQQMHQTDVSYNAMAVLYRMNAQSRVLEEMLVRAGIPYRIYGGMRFYDRKEVRDIVAYLRVIVNPADDVSLRRIINQPKRSIGRRDHRGARAQRGGAGLFALHGDAGAAADAGFPCAKVRRGIRPADDPAHHRARDDAAFGIRAKADRRDGPARAVYEGGFRRGPERA